MQLNFFFFNDTATTEIYTLSLHDALPICQADGDVDLPNAPRPAKGIGHHNTDLAAKTVL